MNDPDDWADDIGNLYLLQDSFIRMPTELPSERERREQMYGEAGVLTREVLVRALLGEFNP